MRCIALLILVFIGCTHVQANDGAVTGIGGRWRFLPGEHSTVRMVREAIRIDVYPEYYDVRADFVFKNEGRGRTVQMGFPEKGGGDINPAAYRNVSGFTRFATWVDGRRVKVQRVAGAGSELVYNALWIKHVPFGANQTRRVRVRYRAPHGTHAGAGFSSQYDFTGGNWRGNVERSTLTVVTHLPGRWQLGATSSDKPLPIRRRDNRFYYQWSNWQAQSGFSFWSASMLRGSLSFKDPSHSFDTHTYLENPERTVVDSPMRNYYAAVEKTGVYYRPPAVLRDGLTYINLNALGQWLSHKVGLRKDSNLVVRDERDKHLKTITLNVYSSDGRDPQAIRHSLRFTQGRKEMVLDGNKVIALPAAPFNLGPLDVNFDTYVPLRPIAQLLGGWARVDAGKHTLHFTAPTYEFWK